MSKITQRSRRDATEHAAPGLSTCHTHVPPTCRRYNQLLRIEEELGDKAIYSGADFRLPP